VKIAHLLKICELEGVGLFLTSGGALKLTGQNEAIKIVADQLRPFKNELIAHLQNTAAKSWTLRSDAGDIAPLDIYPPCSLAEALQTPPALRMNATAAAIRPDSTLSPPLVITGLDRAMIFQWLRAIGETHPEAEAETARQCSEEAGMLDYYTAQARQSNRQNSTARHIEAAHEVLKRRAA